MITQNGYTKGPWILHPYNSRMGSLVSYGDIGKGENVACVFALKDAVEGKANARLIAAAPELLEALKAIMPALNQLSEADYYRLAPIAHAAIAKAEGR